MKMTIHPGAEPQTDAEKALVGFLDDWEVAWPQMRDSYDRWITEDFSWENSGSAPRRARRRP
jgi:limonene-1,2-epoxide hydrolase